MRRLVAASESLAIGFGGTSQVSRQTGVSRNVWWIPSDRSRMVAELLHELGYSLQANRPAMPTAIIASAFAVETIRVLIPCFAFFWKACTTHSRSPIRSA